VHVRGVSAQEDASLAEAGCDPVLDAEARRPEDLLDARTRCLWPAGVEEFLDVGEGRNGWCLVHRGHHAVAPLRQWCHHDEPLRGEEELHLVVGQRPTHAHVGQHEGLGIGLALKRYAERSSHEAVPAVAADDVAGPHPPLPPRTPHDKLDSSFVLSEPDRFVLPK